MDKNTQITKNFKYGEFFCEGVEPPEILEGNIKRVAVELQKIRDYFGKSIKITSGYRTIQHNSEVGGAANSQHIYGLAVDIIPPSTANVSQVYKYAKSKTLFMGFGIGKTFIHLDLRNTKFKQVWYY